VEESAYAIGFRSASSSAWLLRPVEATWGVDSGCPVARGRLIRHSAGISEFAF